MYAVHFGVTKAFNRSPELPAGYLTDGDSFLIWGEGDKDDDTLHVIALENERPDRDRITQLRKRLALYVSNFGERLFDYAVLSSADDWSTLDGVFDDTTIWTPMEGEVELVG